MRAYRPGLTTLRDVSDTSSLQAPPTASLWRMTTANAALITCPECAAPRGRRCTGLNGRYLPRPHPKRSQRYLDLRYAVGGTPRKQTNRQAAAVVVSGPALASRRVPDPAPWRMPLPELAQSIAASFIDRAKVVTAEACGAERAGLTELLYGPDRISESIDALIWARHDLIIAQETRPIASGRDPRGPELAWQETAVDRRLQEARSELKRQRHLTLDTASDHQTSAMDDPRHVARRWLGRHHPELLTELLTEHARSHGLDPSRLIRRPGTAERIQRAIQTGLLPPPTAQAAAASRDESDQDFRRRVLADALRQENRDDLLCHPLLLQRWRQHLHALRRETSARAGKCSPHQITALPVEQIMRTTTEDLQRLAGRRRLLGSLIQRTAENGRLTTACHDSIALAEQRDPDLPVIQSVVEAAYDVMVRTHRDEYNLIRDCLAPYETRYGRLMLDEASKSAAQYKVAQALSRERPGSRSHTALS